MRHSTIHPPASRRLYAEGAGPHGLPAAAEATASGPSGGDARLTPISGGDAILEPFWDPALAAWQKWSQAVDGVKADCRQSWCMVTLDCTAAAADVRAPAHTDQ